MCVMDPPSKPQLCFMDCAGRHGGGRGRPLFTWPVDRSSEVLLLPARLSNGREKGDAAHDCYPPSVCP